MLWSQIKNQIMDFKKFNSEPMFKEEYNGDKGIQYKHQFENGYGASIIRHKTATYGGANGLYELAVLYMGKINYYHEYEIIDCE